MTRVSLSARLTFRDGAGRSETYWTTPLAVQNSARGREWAESSFAWPIVARKHLEFFETILDGPNSRIA